MTNILLLGNLNVGKTVLFNQLCRKRQQVANYPGTTVSIGRGNFYEANRILHLIDTPGINSIIPTSEDEIISRDILLQEDIDIIAYIADGKNLRRSLLLFLQLINYHKLMVFNINMMDEARQYGIEIDTKKLSSILGIEVTQTVATEGEGVHRFRHALVAARKPTLLVKYHPDIETALTQIEDIIRPVDNIPSRALALMLLGGDESIKKYIEEKFSQRVISKIDNIVNSTQAKFYQPLRIILTETIMRKVDRILEEVVTISPPIKVPFSEKVGKWTREPLTGIPIAICIIFLMYLFIGKFGVEFLVSLTEGKLFREIIIPFTEKIVAYIPFPIIQRAITGEFGLLSVGLTLAFGIVLPILVVFFLAFSFLEDSGYFPRFSILLDRILKKIGLGGKGALPLILGFSCITMAILTTRMLDTRRERIIASLLLVLCMPCSPFLAAMFVILASLPIWTLIIVFGIIVCQIIVVGMIISKLLPGKSSDFILDIPPIRFPKLKSILIKTFTRSKWFIIEAVPLFLIATFIIFIFDEIGFLLLLQHISQPVVNKFLGLPVDTVECFIMAVIRREAGVALLKEIFDRGLLDHIQIIVSILTMTFLIPCVNTMLIIIKELGVKVGIIILIFVSSYAILCGGLLNFVLRALSNVIANL